MHLKPIIYNKDIEANSQYAFLENMLETKVQQYCKKLFEWSLAEHQMSYAGFFQQNDNGTDSSKAKNAIMNKMRKKAEGTISGWPDVSLVLQGGIVIYVEFKRIGTPSQIDIKDKQITIHHQLKQLGFKTYITNNPIFFEQVIMKEVVEVIKKNLQ